MAADDLPGTVIPPRPVKDPLAPPDPLELAGWRLAVGAIPASDLPDLAADALVRGADSPSLRQLAGTPRDDGWKIDRLWVDTARELGLSIASEPSARRLLIRAVLRDIVAGRTQPLSGAFEILELRHQGADGTEPWDVIAWMFYQEEETPEERPAIEREIRATATRLLEQDGAG